MRAIILSCALVLFGVGHVTAQENADPLGTMQSLGTKSAQVSFQARAASQSASAQQSNVEAPVKFGSNINKNFSDAIGLSGIKNITDAEQVFCYEVANKPTNYQGYTINNMAVTGFCGVLNPDLANMINVQLFETASNFSFDTAENCVINARVVLRYVRGVDSTDVVLSAPCHSMIVYYGGGVKVFNMRPSAELIGSIVDAFGQNKVDFASPALLNQMLPIGIPQTVEQKNLVDSKGASQPVRNWDQPSGQAAESADKPKSGWNNLNM